VEREQASRPTRLRQLVSTVYDAQGGGRSPVLDGPWWLGLTAAVVAVVLAFGGGPWRWVALAVFAIFFWLPFVARWAVVLARSVGAFRDGFRS
jgi:hypothetical protein